MRRYCFALVVIVLSARLPAENELHALLNDLEPTVSNGALPGYGIEFFTAMEQETGLKFDLSVQPGVRNVVELANPDVARVALLPEQTRVFASLQKVGRLFDHDLFILPAPGRPSDSLADFTGQKIGRLRGGCTSLEGQLNPADLVELNNFAQGIKMLRANRLAGVCGSSTALGWHLKLEGKQWQDFPAALALSKQGMWLVATQAVPAAIVLQLREGFQRLEDKGYLKTLSARYALSHAE